MALNSYTNTPPYKSYIDSYRSFFQTLFINISFLLYVYIWCILQLPALTFKLHRPQMQYVVYSWIHFCINVFPGLLMWWQTSSRRLCPQNSPEERLWPTTADPSLSTSWMSTSANYTMYLRRQERAWWGKPFLINVKATCVCSSLIHRLIHFLHFSTEWSCASWKSCSD